MKRKINTQMNEQTHSVRASGRFQYCDFAYFRRLVRVLFMSRSVVRNAAIVV